MFLPLTVRDRLIRRPWAVSAIAALCVAELLWTRLLHAPERNAFVTVREPTHLVTYAFAHASFGHLLGNVFFLVTFGRVLEARWGRLLTIACFFLASIGGGVLYALAAGSDPHPLVGASGAIAGLAGALVVALPNVRFDRLLSPLFWPATPILALVRGRGVAALLKLIPVYGWVLRIEAGVPALFVVPAWLSVDLLSMFAYPTARVAYACHVGGALTGVLFAGAVRIFGIDRRIAKALAELGAELDPIDTDAEDSSALAPAVRARRAQNRPTEWPSSRAAAGWFVASFALTAVLFVVGLGASDRIARWRAAHDTAAIRARYLASRVPGDEAPSALYEHELFRVSYPPFFWACAPDRTTDGPCTDHVRPASPFEAGLSLVHPDVPSEVIFVRAFRGGASHRSDLVEAFAKTIAAKATRSGEALRLVETTSGSCHGDYSVGAVQEIGDELHGVQLRTCAFGAGNDLYLFAYVLPLPLRDRDGVALASILAGIALPDRNEAMRRR